MKKFSYLTILALLISQIHYSQSIAYYDFSLTTIWNSSEHTSIPAGAHWSALVGATHNIENEFVEIGAVAPATDGIKDIAELGNSNNFRNEVNTAIALTKADQWINAGGLGNPVGTFIYNDLAVNENFPLITLISMVAPSPDWFIAVNSVNLRSNNTAINNGWKDSFTLDVFAYDTGTDDGINYDSGNIVSNPRVPIFKLTTSPINGNKMGTITFTYKSSTLSVANANALEHITLHPNPSKGIFTISNLQKIDLQTIKIYNILGHLVKAIQPTNRDKNLRIIVSDLNPGMYLLKLNTIEGKSFTRKIIVE